MDKFSAWRRSKAAAKTATQQPKESLAARDAQQQQQQQSQQQQQQQAIVSRRQQQQQQPKQHEHDSHRSCQRRQAAWRIIETRSSKKRKIALTPVGAAAPDPELPANPPSPPTPICGAILHTDGAEEAPMTSPAHQEREKTTESEMPSEASYRPAPEPPPMTRLYGYMYVQPSFHSSVQKLLEEAPQRTF